LLLRTIAYPKPHLWLTPQGFSQEYGANLQDFSMSGVRALAFLAGGGYFTGMFQKLVNLLSGAEEAPEEDTQAAARVAIAALLVEAARADEVYLDAEREMIEKVLAERFGLSEEAAGALRVEGEAAQAEAVDLVRFTRVIKDAVPFEERIEVIEAMWRVIYADDDRDHTEAALIRRLAGLLYIPDRDAGMARQRVVDDQS
jgi:uncharacterized tellurite resistance protein B-like protein